MNNYKYRITDELIKKKLKGKGAVLIEGPKWCGKTTSAEQIAKSILYLAKPDEVKQNLLLADLNPSLLLEGETPRLIDEWQVAPKLWDAIRFEVDHRNMEGQFILTGSSVPADQAEILHTGTGRFAWILMRPMSLFESGESNGSVSLKSLLDHPQQIVGMNLLDINKIAFLVCRGGWPRATFLEDEIALEQAYDYYDAIVKSDISRVDGVKRDSERVKQLMRAYARNQGQSVSYEKLKQDMISNDNDSLDSDTILSYVRALKKIFVVDETPAWNPNLRSKAAIRMSDIRYFIDPSIGVAALGVGPNDLIKDLNTFGFLFESLCMRDLKVYAQALNGNVYHYRDNTGLECDAVIHLRNGSYGLIEIKLGGDSLIEEGAASLIKLRDNIDSTKMNRPSFMMVLIGVGKYAYQREDGVYVVPIGCLRN
ncbi:ATP-binding protein [Dielma fastidiosa]|uniref:ATP-binding protein n=1 Tax=Dielma fastidiosa TaxID=1034346 RepID=UPI003562AC2C